MCLSTLGYVWLAKISHVKNSHILAMSRAELSMDLRRRSRSNLSLWRMATSFRATTHDSDNEVGIIAAGWKPTERDLVFHRVEVNRPRYGSAAAGEIPDVIGYRTVEGGTGRGWGISIRRSLSSTSAPVKRDGSCCRLCESMWYRAPVGNSRDVRQLITATCTTYTCYAACQWRQMQLWNYDPAMMLTLYSSDFWLTANLQFFYRVSLYATIAIILRFMGYHCMQHRTCYSSYMSVRFFVC